MVINGERAPRLVWKAGARHRVRLINITPDDIFSVSLQSADAPLMWTPVAKDGAPVPAADAVAGRGARQTIAVGETYEFEYQAPGGPEDCMARSAHHRRQMAGAGPRGHQVGYRCIAFCPRS